MDVVGSGSAKVDSFVVGVEVGCKEVLDKPDGEGLLGTEDVPTLHVHEPGGQVEVYGDVADVGGWCCVSV